MTDDFPFSRTTMALLAGGVVLLAALTAWTLDGDLVSILIVMAAALAAIAMLHAQPATTIQPLIDTALPPSAAITSDQRYRPIIDQLPEPALLAQDGRVIAANAAARTLLGGHVIGADVRTALPHPGAAETLASFQQSGAQQSGAQQPGTTRGTGGVDLVGLGGRGQRWTMRLLDLGDDGLLILLSDATMRAAVDKMRSDFVANASHELRTPLAAILGYVETLSDPETANDVETRTRFLGVMGREASRMQRLVDDLLSISRVEASKGERPTESVLLDALARSTVQDLQAIDATRVSDVQITVTDGGDAPVRGDRAQLGQLLHNLIGNAMKYGRAGTPVDVTVHPSSGDMVEIIVRDYGDGIPARHLPRLTERFYRVDSARSRALGGTGLGLAIVKNIVERHNGRLDISSVEGDGTTISVRLPRYR